MNDYIESNRRHWDELVPIHVRSTFYDVESFKAGRSTLTTIEHEELGDVCGKSLLHLQCHFGLDTLSWAREGARVTGVDFSPEAVRVARDLAQELHLEAAFLESDVYKLPQALSGAFDIVFASYGVICWLPDFPRWATIAASYVKPGGIFYLLDSHPAGSMLDDTAADSLKLRYPYFSAGTPLTFEGDGSYADRSAKAPQWAHLRVHVRPRRNRYVTSRRRPADRVPARIPLRRLPMPAPDAPRRRRLLAPPQ